MSIDLRRSRARDRLFSMAGRDRPDLASRCLSADELTPTEDRLATSTKRRGVRLDFAETPRRLVSARDRGGQRTQDRRRG